MIYIDSPQAKKRTEIKEPESDNFATIGSVYADGVTLYFDSVQAESVKHYKVNNSVVFRAGDRVRIIKDSGTYVVEYVVGNPKSSIISDAVLDVAYPGQRIEFRTTSPGLQFRSSRYPGYWYSLTTT